MFTRQIEKKEAVKSRQSADSAKGLRTAAMKHAPMLRPDAGTHTASLFRGGLADMYRTLPRASDSSIHGNLDAATRQAAPATGSASSFGLLCLKMLPAAHTPRLTIQAQLQVGRVDDPLEQEADRIAEAVMSGPGSASLGAAPRISRKRAAYEGGGRLQAQSAALDLGGEAPGIVHDALRSPGRSLDASTRISMELRFGQDFSKVRVHNSSTATQSAQALNANAYTVGNNIVFGANQFAPGTAGGDRLIAHELTHVVQQSGSGASQGQVVQRDAKKGSPAAVKPQPTQPGQATGGVAYQEDLSAAKVNAFWATVSDVGAKERAEKLVREAVARLIAERGPELKDLTEKIDSYKYSFQTREDWQRHLAWTAEREKIFEEYDPSVQRSSRLPTTPFTRLPYATTNVPLSGPPAPIFADYPENFIPDNPTRYGKFAGVFHDDTAVRSSVGDAYAYHIQTDNFQVGNDLERLARAGYAEIHIATGTHGSKGGAAGGPWTEVQFLKQDARSIYETMQRHPGLKIIPYNMGDPAQLAKFDALQALAADHQLPGGATLAAFCYSRTRVYDPNEGPASPYGSVEVLTDRPSLSVSFTRGGFTALFGAMSIYGGMNDPNRLAGGVKIAAGGAQILGGASYAAGDAMDSLSMVRWGSRLGEAGGYVGSAMALYDFYRGMSSKFEPGGSRVVSGEEALAGSIDDTLRVAGAIFPEAAVAAVVLQYAVKPGAQKVAEFVTPTFLGAIAEIYNPASWRHY